VIDRGLPRPGLLAHVIVSKYADHLPLYRQSEIYTREGIDLDRSTLAGWVGGVTRTMEPLVDALRRYEMSTGKLHGDDTPVLVLTPGNCKTKTGCLWTHVRDDRPAGDQAAPAAWFAYSPDRKGDHSESHLSGFRGTLQANGYAGFHRVYEKGLVQEASCWARCPDNAVVSSESGNTVPEAHQASRRRSRAPDNVVTDLAGEQGAWVMGASGAAALSGGRISSRRPPELRGSS
jgi:hypothetical protein